MSGIKVGTCCPECKKPLQVDPQLLGKSVRCPGCRQTFVVSSVCFSQPTQRGATVPAAAATETRMHSARSAETSGGARSGSSVTTPTASHAGRFELHEVLGRGGYGVVYRAHDPLLDRPVAVKVPLFASTDQKRSQRFLNEAKAAAQLRHPNIVAVFESGQSNGMLFLAAEYVQGQTLAERLKASRPAVEQAVRWVRDIAGALAYAHAQGIVHRDIKPHNVMIDSLSRPQVMDFGLAKRLDQDSTITSEGALLGTPAYMSPEQSRGDTDQVGPASDQYSLGVVLYELLTGERPFDGPPAVVIAKVAAEDPRPPRQINRDISQELEAICQRAMHRDWRRRYAEIAEMEADLDHWLRGEAVSVKPIPRWTRISRWGRRQPVIACLTLSIAVLLIATAVGGALAWTRTLRSRNELAEALQQAELQTARTSEQTRRAQSAAAVARTKITAAEAAAAEALKKRTEMERVFSRLETTVAQKAKAEQMLAEAIAAEQAASEKAKQTADNLAATTDAATNLKFTSAGARQAHYLAQMDDARKCLDHTDWSGLTVALDACPEEERKWEWRFLNAVSKSRNPQRNSWIVFSMTKDRRLKDGGPAKDRKRVRYGVTARDMFNAPDWDEDPPWANVPPSQLISFATSGVPEMISPTGTVLLTRTAGKSRTLVSLWDIAEQIPPRLITSATAPFGNVDVPSFTHRKRPQKGPVAAPKAFAFSQDGSRVAEISSLNDDLSPAPVRILPVGPGKTWEQLASPYATREELVTAMATYGGGAKGVLAAFNDHQPDESSRFVLAEDMAVSPDGSRRAALGEDGRIHILDVQANRKVLSFASGLDAETFLNLHRVKPNAWKYTLHAGGVAWSRDGKRLLVQAHLDSSYVWGTEETIPDNKKAEQIEEEEGRSARRKYERGAAVKVDLWTPLIRFDVVIIYTAEQAS